jgi:hypothetical protein
MRYICDRRYDHQNTIWVQLRKADQKLRTQAGRPDQESEDGLLLWTGGTGAVDGGRTRTRAH